MDTQSAEELPSQNKGRLNVDVFIVIGFAIAWILLQIFVLPKMGVRT